MFHRVKALLRRPSITAFFDQISLSGVNFISIILLARYCKGVDFAAYGLALAILAFCVSLQRSVVVLPMMVASSDPNTPSIPGKWVWVNAGFVVVVSATLICAAAAFAGRGESGNYALHAIELALVTTPAMLLYEFPRRVMYMIGGNYDATIGASLVATLYGAGVMVSILITGTTFATSLGMGLGGIAGCAFITLRHRGQIGGFDTAGFQQWWSLTGNTSWHLASFLAHSTYNTALPIVTATVGSPSAVAALVATRNLANPALTIATAVDSFEKPRASKAFRRAGPVALMQSVSRTRRLLLGINIPLLILLAIFAHSIVNMMRPENPELYVTLIYIWIPIVLATILNQPFETVLIIQRRSAVLFWAKAVAGVLLLGLTLLLVPKLGALGALYATLVAMVANLLINAARVRRVAA